MPVPMPTRSTLPPPPLAAIAALALCAALPLGCGSEDDMERRTGSAVGADCPLPKLTQQCMCDGMDVLSGRQVCTGEGWGSCECLTPEQAVVEMQMVIEMQMQEALFASDPPGNRSPNRFEWERTEATGGSCEAGHYEGSFEGIYNAPIAFNAPIPVASVPGTPGLIFDLAKEGGGEVFNVSGGKMEGLANGFVPFSADIEGSLDCQTRKFEAMILNGKYTVGIFDYLFEGPITADYDKLTHTMVNGTWNVVEPATPGSGGMGSWTVTWVP